MLYPYLTPFSDYFKLAEFSNRSFQAMASRINEFQHYLQDQNIKSIKKIHYKHLRVCRGLSQPFHSCHKIPRLDAAPVLSLPELARACEGKHRYPIALSENRKNRPGLFDL
ncbi:MAG: hypothetical protein KKF30_14005 [Proteobacteria bacterium]|nr:hypothetical protein [Pseudomonadota bacterium]